MDDVDRIFDAISNFSCAMLRLDAIRQKEQELFEAQKKECGSCFHWMKSSCVPEKERWQFKSMSSHVCKDFHRTGRSIELIKQREEELQVLKKDFEERYNN